MASTDFSQLPRDDKAFLGLGALVFIASFLPWYGYSYDIKVAGFGTSSSASINAWHGLAAFGLVLMLAATVLVAVQLFAADSLPSSPVSWNIVVVALDGLGALFVIIRSFDLPSASIPGGSVGLRWGGWVLILAALAQVAFAAIRFRASGEPMPWAAPHDPASPPAS